MHSLVRFVPFFLGLLAATPALAWCAALLAVAYGFAMLAYRRRVS